MLLVFFTLFAIVKSFILVGILMLVGLIIMLVGFISVNPNNSRILVLFGKYKGTVKKTDFIG